MFERERCDEVQSRGEAGLLLQCSLVVELEFSIQSICDAVYPNLMNARDGLPGA